MLRQVLNGKGGSSLTVTTLFRQMHIGSGGGSDNHVSSLLGRNCSAILSSTVLQKHQETPRSGPWQLLKSDMIITQAKQGGILDMPMHSVIRPSIGIPPDMLRRRPDYGVPINQRITPAIETPSITGNLDKEIRDSPDSQIIEKQAARLIVIRRSKMNKHKLRKLRKKMKYVWAKIRLRRAIRREKEYLNSKMELINSAKKFDAKEYVAGIIKRAKEEPIPYKWTDPLMPEWYKEQEMKKEAWQKRYQKMINLYLNKGITIDWKEKKIR